MHRQLRRALVVAMVTVALSALAGNAWADDVQQERSGGLLSLDVDLDLGADVALGSSKDGVHGTLVDLDTDLDVDADLQVGPTTKTRTTALDLEANVDADLEVGTPTNKTDASSVAVDADGQADVDVGTSSKRTHTTVLDLEADVDADLEVGTPKKRTDAALADVDLDAHVAADVTVEDEHDRRLVDADLDADVCLRLVLLGDLHPGCDVSANGGKDTAGGLVVLDLETGADVEATVGGKRTGDLLDADLDADVCLRLTLLGDAHRSCATEDAGVPDPDDDEDGNDGKDQDDDNGNGESGSDPNGVDAGEVADAVLEASAGEVTTGVVRLPVQGDLPLAAAADAQLARTGVATTWLTALAAFLLLLGSGALVTSRRRRAVQRP